MTKAMLASDAIESKIKFPCIIQPKIDGVRGLNLNGALTGRSLKSHANVHSTNYFSQNVFRGFDGEMAVEHECNPNLCRLTSSALSTIAGQPWLMWHVFDYITPETIALPYRERFAALDVRMRDIRNGETTHQFSHHLRLIQSMECLSLEILQEVENVWLDMGYEGLIIRDPDGMYKEGRSTAKEGGLLRVKRFVEAEGAVVSLIEGEQNGNEAQINELGLQFRSSHQENMIPNGQIGSMIVRLIADVVYRGETLFRKGQEINVGAGKMPVFDRAKYFKNPELIVGEVIKFKTFPIGVKQKPRFPTFQSFRAASDM